MSGCLCHPWWLRGDEFEGFLAAEAIDYASPSPFRLIAHNVYYGKYHRLDSRPSLSSHPYTRELIKELKRQLTSRN